MNKLIILMAAALFSFWIQVFPAFGETDEEEDQELNLYSQSAVLLDADSGRVLYGKEEETFRPMASTTKIMTCILALEQGNLEDVVTASSNAAGQPKVHLGVRSGEQYYLKDLLYALMLESYNDAAVMIAEHLGEDVEGFAAIMNQKARDLDCNDTFFITPNGLDAKITLKDGSEKIHGTTARDLARIMRYCVMESPKRKEFLEITRTQNYSFMDLKKKRNFSCTNHNAMLSMMQGALSGKTGFTGGAGYSYVGAFESDGRTFTIALLGCGWPPHKTYKWSDARKLYTYGMEHFHYQDVFQKQTLEPVVVEDGIGRDGEGGAQTGLTMNLSANEEHLELLLGKKDEVRVVKSLPKKLSAPVKKGDIVGTITYVLNGEPVKKYPVYASDSVLRIDFLWCLKSVGNRFLFQ